MNYFIGPILYLLFVAILFILVWFLMKKLRNWDAKRQGTNLTEDVINYLKSEQNRRPMQRSAKNKTLKNSIEKFRYCFVIILLFAIIYGLAEGFSRTYLIYMLPAILACLAPVLLLLFIDILRMTPSHDNGLWIGKAYILYLSCYKGYCLTIAYYDFLNNKINTTDIRFDSEDTDQLCVPGDYIDIVLVAKGSRIKYGGVI